MELWYKQPAAIWEASLPLGNGRLGAMPDGGVFKENITLNEISLWSGSEEDTDNPEALQYLPQIRELLLDGKNREAQDMMFRYFKCKGEGTGGAKGANLPFGCFQNLGHLRIDYHYKDVVANTETPKNYRRFLSLNDAMAGTSFNIGGVQYTREYFVSRTHDVIVIKLKTGKKRAINFDVSIDRAERSNSFCRDGMLMMNGQLNNGVDGFGMKYATITKVISEDGIVTTSEKTIHVKDASTAYIFVSATTNFNQNDFESKVLELTEKAVNEPYKSLKKITLNPIRRNSIGLSLIWEKEKHICQPMIV